MLVEGVVSLYTFSANEGTLGDLRSPEQILVSEMVSGGNGEGGGGGKLVRQSVSRLSVSFPSRLKHIGCTQGDNP